MRVDAPAPPPDSAVDTAAPVGLAGLFDRRAVTSSRPAPPVSPLDVDLLERRLERRTPVVLPVAAARCDGAGVTAAGRSVNVSTSGLLLVMDVAAPGEFVDLLLGEGSTAVLRGKVLAQHETDADHRWHVLVLEADSTWQSTIEAATRDAP
jgi:hypothetical protein